MNKKEVVLTERLHQYIVSVKEENDLEYGDELVGILYSEFYNNTMDKNAVNYFSQNLSKISIAGNGYYSIKDESLVEDGDLVVSRKDVLDIRVVELNEDSISDSRSIRVTNANHIKVYAGKYSSSLPDFYRDFILLCKKKDLSIRIPGYKERINSRMRGDNYGK